MVYFKSTKLWEQNENAIAEISAHFAYIIVSRALHLQNAQCYRLKYVRILEPYSWMICIN